MSDQEPPALHDVPSEHENESLDSNCRKDVNCGEREFLGDDDRPSKVRALIVILRSDYAQDPGNERISVGEGLLCQSIVEDNEDNARTTSCPA